MEFIKIGNINDFKFPSVISVYKYHPFCKNPFFTQNKLHIFTRRVIIRSMKTYELTEKKEFMRLLLCSETFDHFLVSEASIHTVVRYEVDGRINKDFYSKEELAEKQLDGLAFLPYGRLRPFFYDLIRGRHTPSYFKFVLMLSPDNQRNTVLASGTSIQPSDVGALYINIQYRDGRLILTSGVSYLTFIPDKSFDKEWDRYAANFLKKNHVTFLYF